MFRHPQNIIVSNHLLLSVALDSVCSVFDRYHAKSDRTVLGQVTYAYTEYSYPTKQTGYTLLTV